MSKFKVGDNVKIINNSFVITSVREYGDDGHVEYECDGTPTSGWNIFEQDLELDYLKLPPYNMETGNYPSCSCNSSPTEEPSGLDYEVEYERLLAEYGELQRKYEILKKTVKELSKLID